MLIGKLAIPVVCGVPEIKKVKFPELLSAATKEPTVPVNPKTPVEEKVAPPINLPPAVTVYGILELAVPETGDNWYNAPVWTLDEQSKVVKDEGIVPSKYS